MSSRSTFRLRFWLTVLVTLAESAHLAWEYFHGGIVSHHLLNRADLPAISNLWGLLLLPVLTWFLSGIALRRGRAESGANARAALAPGAMAGFLIALVFGAVLALCFTLGYPQGSSFLFRALLVLAVLFRVYRAECLLGFVLGLTFTFGAVLPTLIGSFVAMLSAVVHLAVRPAAARLFRLARRQSQPRA